MPTAIPDDWLIAPPQILVVGDGPYSAALSGILAAPRVLPQKLLVGLDPNSNKPSVLDDLEKVFVVVNSSQSAADVLCCHEALWKWVIELTFAKDEHDLSIQFILPLGTGTNFEESLAVGLAAPSIDPQSTGHGISRMSDGLDQLLEVASRIVPKDLICLHGRRMADASRKALGQLHEAAAKPDFAATRAAATEVLELFHRREHDLDLFCRPPCHQNGNKLRWLLEQIVTKSVTQDYRESSTQEVLNLLV